MVNDLTTSIQAHSLRDLEHACLREMAENDCSFDGPLLMNAGLKRYSRDSSNSPDEWYVCYEGISSREFPYLNCTYGSWSDSATYMFKSYEKNTLLSEADRHELQEIHRKRQEEAQRLLEEEAKERIRRAQDAWKRASPNPSTKEHMLYLTKKRIGAHGIRFSETKDHESVVVIPLTNIEGEVQAVQYIKSDGEKRIYGVKKGNFHIIGEITDNSHIRVSEGYATGSTIHEIISDPVVVAFDCGNLLPVVENIKNKFPVHALTIMGDDDIHTKGNPGRAKAEAAAITYGCKVSFPHFPAHYLVSKTTCPTDFNDLYHLLGVDAFRKQIQGHSQSGSISQEWEDPLELDESLLPVPSFDPMFLPEPLRDYAVDIADRMQCPLDFPAIGLLVLFSSLIGTRCAIRPKELDSWTVVPNLWGGIIAPPGYLKSPALSESTSVLGYLERLADQEYQKVLLNDNVNKLEQKLRRDRIEKELKRCIESESEAGIEGHKSALVNLEKEHTTIPKKRYKSTDPTVPKLTEILKENPQGILILRDELVGFLASLEKEGHEEDRAFYLDGWNGYSSSSRTSDRIIRGTTDYNPCISILGGIQPSKLRRYLADTINNISNDGFFQRFQLLVYPDTSKTFNLVDRKPNKIAKDLVFKIAKAITETDFTKLGAKIDDSFPFPFFQFDASAQEFFNAWYTKLMHRKFLGTEDEILIEHFNKYAKLMPSLALINHLINHVVQNLNGYLSPKKVLKGYG